MQGQFKNYIVVVCVHVFISSCSKHKNAEDVKGKCGRYPELCCEPFPPSQLKSCQETINGAHNDSVWFLYIYKLEQIAIERSASKS